MKIFKNININKFVIYSQGPDDGGVAAVSRNLC